MKLNDIASAEIDVIAKELENVFNKLERAKVIEGEVIVPSRIVAEMLYLRGVRVVED